MFDRPKISVNDRMSAGGLTFEVVRPFERLDVSCVGELCLLDRPRQMSDPRRVFRDNPRVPARISLEVGGASPMNGRERRRVDGTADVVDPSQSFAKAHY
jgi:hypothetical protein